MPDETKRFQCRHIFTDGRRCGSPCLRKPEGHEDFCYYHHTSRRPAPCVGRSRRRTTTFTLPLLEDRSAVQHSISQVLQKLAQNELDPRRAGLLLYGLQIASINLPPQKRAEPEKAADTVEEITIDKANGALALDSELIPPLREKDSARDVLEAWNRRGQREAANTLPSLRAVAVQPHRRSTANANRCKTLRKTVRVGSMRCPQTSSPRAEVTAARYRHGIQHSVCRCYASHRSECVAEIIEFKVRPAASPTPVDVSGRVSEFMYAFHLLDRAELKTTFYNFDSCWQQGCRTWKVDGVEVNQEDFEEHLTEWLRERAQRRFQPAGTVLPMVIQRVSGR